MRLALIMLAVFAVQGWAEEKFTLVDGRELIGTYDDAKHLLSAVTPNGRAVIGVEPSQIVKRITLVAPPAPVPTALREEPSPQPETPPKPPPRLPVLPSRDELLAKYVPLKKEYEASQKRTDDLLEKSHFSDMMKWLMANKEQIDGLRIEMQSREGTAEYQDYISRFNALTQAHNKIAEKARAVQATIDEEAKSRVVDCKAVSEIVREWERCDYGSFPYEGASIENEVEYMISGGFYFMKAKRLLRGGAAK